MRRVVIGIIVVVILLVGVGCSEEQSDTSTGNEQTTTADSVPDVNTLSVNTNVDLVSAEGTIVPLRDVTLAFQAGGQVTEVLVEEGSVVTKGAPLVRLDAADALLSVTQAELAVTQAEAGRDAAVTQLSSAQTAITLAQLGVDAAEAQLALLMADPLPEQIAVNEGSIASADAGVTQASANQAVTLEGPNASQIAAAQAELQAAEAQRKPVADALGDITRFEIGGDAEEQTRLALNAAQASVNAAQARLDELNVGATNAQRRAAGAAVAAAVAQRDVTQAQLDLLLAGPKPAQIRVAEIGLEQARASVQEAETSVIQLEAAVTQAESNVTQAQASLSTAQAALHRLTLTAPFDGVVADVSLELGEVVAPGVPVVTLADFGGWLVETTDLTELDVVSVRVGQSANIQVDAIPDEVLTGTVTDIATVSSLTRGDVTYSVEIRLDDTNLPLRWGMTVFADIDVE